MVLTTKTLQIVLQKLNAHIDIPIYYTTRSLRSLCSNFVDLTVEISADTFVCRLTGVIN